MTGRRTITLEELQQIVAEHEKWVDSDGKVGSRACLRGCDLSGAELVGVGLARADLSEADLSSADLTGTEFEDAALTNTDLREVKGLAADRLGGADLTGAQLPPHIAQFRSLEYVAEVSRNARVTFFTLLLVCAYAILTIVTTTDHRLITNNVSSPIPLTGTEAPIIWFYRLMPAVIVLIYVYLLLYLGRLWRRLPALPAKFPDGTPLTSTVYPWLLNEQIRQYMPNLSQRRPPLYRYDILFSIVLAWFVPPVTIIALWWRYLPKHDTVTTMSHIALLVVALFIGTILFALMILTLRREIGPLALPSQRKVRPLFKLLREVPWLGVPALLMAVFIVIISIGVFSGDANRFDPCNLCVPNLLKTAWYRSYADLRDKEISQRPETWSNEQQLFQAVRGADLEGHDLRYADARGAFLFKAILRSADLEKADLRGADLRHARLINANLEGAHLEDAHLREAVLVGATLKGAFLKRAKLQEANLINADFSRTEDPAREDARADLTDANLTGAKLRNANLNGAILRGAVLDGADLRAANLAGAEGLTRAQLTTACGDENTIIPRALWDYTLDPCKN